MRWTEHRKLATTAAVIAAISIPLAILSGHPLMFFIVGMEVGAAAMMWGICLGWDA